MTGHISGWGAMGQWPSVPAGLLLAGLSVACGSGSEGESRSSSPTGGMAGTLGHDDDDDDDVAADAEGGRKSGMTAQDAGAGGTETSGRGGSSGERADATGGATPVSGSAGGNGGSTHQDKGSAGNEGGSPASSVASSGANAGGWAGTSVASTGGDSTGLNAGAGGSAEAGAQGIAPGGSGGSAGDGSCVAEQVNLVLLVDKSGSMGDTVAEFPNAALHWNALHEALDDFLVSPEVSGLSASLTFLPVHGDYDIACSLASYEVPAVSLGAPGDLLSAIHAIEPSGGTPMLPAVMGSLSYAKQLATSIAGSQSVLIVLTSGDPVVVDATTGEARTDNCPPGNENTIENIAAVARAAYAGSPSIPVYIIGFGELAPDMAPVATAGGTEFYGITGDTTEGNAALALSALQEIRAIETACAVSGAAGSGQ